MKTARFYILSAVITLAVCGFSVSAYAASFVNLRTALDVSTMKKMNMPSDATSMFNLSIDNNLKILDITKGKGNTKYIRYQQHFKGVPIWGENVIIVLKKGIIKRLRGRVAKKIGDDLFDVNPSFTSEAALVFIKNNKNYFGMYFKDEKSKLVIYVDDSSKAHLAYFVSFFADLTEGGKPTRPHFLINAKTKEILKQWEGLTHIEAGTGPGGNEKTGEYQYGTDYGFLDVSVTDNTCTMMTDNVKTIDLEHGTHSNITYSYSCYENTHEKINGGFSPLNDAHYFGNIIYNLYNDWYGIPPLTFQLTMKVHYGNCYDNAFWDGTSMTFGDGCDDFYPLVSLDVSAHEVSHGFTEQNSNLVYSGQPGGINESFSDIAGESAEYYMSGTTDFEVGAQILKASNQALRYMYNPPLDGKSIGHVDDYYSGIDVHYSSGVFNKAFYLLATTEGWNVRKAFDCFVGANRNYWSPNSDFIDAANGVLDMAQDLGYPAEDVQSVFLQVGISLSLPGPPTADFSVPKDVCTGANTQLTDLSSNSPDSWLWTISPSTFSYQNDTDNTSQNPVVQFDNEGSYSVTLYTSNIYGNDTITKTEYINVSSGNVIQFDLLTDIYGNETTWDVTDSSSTILFQGGPYGNSQNFTEEFCLIPDESYSFTIYDSFGDGICCNYGVGYYSLTNISTGEVYVDSGGEFQNSETTHFTIGDGGAAITLLSPADGSILPPLPEQTFSWQGDTGYRFKLEFSPTSSFPREFPTISIPRDWWMADTSTNTLPPIIWGSLWNIVKNMEWINGIVYWRVVGEIDPTVPAVISEVRTFSIEHFLLKKTWKNQAFFD